MSNRITIDPITRIEGHLRVDVSIDAGKVTDSWASGTMFRGIETILQGRDPREAWLYTQRFCGVCTTVHAIASVRSVENAAGINVPLNAQYIRNLILIAHALQDHVVHFYHLCALDWVDVVSALKADPAKTAALAGSLSNWHRNGYQDFKQVQNRVKAFVENGQLGIFANGYWGHPAMKLPPEVNLLAVAHYLQALEYQRQANQIVAILGGKTPNIQNLAVGGVANAINLDNEATLNMEKLYTIKSLFTDLIEFVHKVYFVDACAVAALYPDWFSHGAGVTNYLAVPDLPLDSAMKEFDLPGGIIFDGKLDQVYTIKNHQDERLRNGVTENVSHAWYEGDKTLHPWKGETNPHYTGFKDDGKYTWVKSPRFEGKPMQVGPLAQVLVGFAQGHKLTVKWASEAIKTVSAIAKIPVKPGMLQSTLGRIAARAIRASMLADLAEKHWGLLVNNIASGDAKIYVKPQFGDKELHGVGFHEAPRGTLSHWVVIKDGAIANYQAVVPTTWNAGPRDEHGTHGPYEASLIGNPVADAEKPLEVLRTIHSFDPCLACAIHTFDPEGKEVISVSDTR
ncbi:MAG TPA: nickel-dependent hydrogenase large subunit [Candidatus Limnocylindrales bacterium]|nr:nickel-dependent hydrogenase large subunit [Candidatus Limnocylindrales bacterium]